ncbi:MAG: hypothetical protein ACYDAD_04450 [Acidimicrobiales bacterium]
MWSWAWLAIPGAAALGALLLVLATWLDAWVAPLEGDPVGQPAPGIAWSAVDLAPAVPGIPLAESAGTEVG